MSFSEASWNTDDLARRLCHALNSAQLALKRLGANGYRDNVNPGNNVRPEKVISETGFLLFVAATADQFEEVSSCIDSLAQLLIPYARSERMRLGMCLEPALVLDYAQAHICLKRIGYPDPGFDELLDQSGQARAHKGRERPPHRVLEQDWLLEGAGGKRRSRSGPSPRNCILRWPMDLLGGGREDIYAFTHALMYISDFNVCPRSLPRRRSIILGEAEAALARCLDEEDYDLAGEILLTWPLTGKSWSAASAFGFRVLAHIEDQAGFLPGSSAHLKSLKRFEGEEGQDYLVATAYHTMFVMGLLCAVALQPGRTPPASIPTNRRTLGCAEWLLQLLDTDRKSTGWREEVESLSISERDALAGFLLNIALYRRAKTRDFSAVHELLVRAYELGLANMPSCSQAAEMLQRIATFAETRHAIRLSDDTSLRRARAIRRTRRRPASGC